MLLSEIRTIIRNCKVRKVVKLLVKYKLVFLRRASIKITLDQSNQLLEGYTESSEKLKTRLKEIWVIVNQMNVTDTQEVILNQ